MVNDVASFCVVDGGCDNLACGCAMVVKTFGIASTGVALGRWMLVCFVLVGWVGGRGGDGSGLSAMVDGFFLANNTGEALQNA
jgi:hypothetical protein